MKNTTLWIALASLFTASNSFASVVKGRVYEDNSNTPIYTFERNETTEAGKRIVESKFFANDGKVALWEKLHYTPGKNIFDLYEFERPLSKEKATVRPENDKLHFVYDDGPEHNTAKESLEENTINREEIPTFVAANWNKLMDGDKLKSRFIVPDRAETIGFGMRKREEVTHKGKPAVRVILFALSPFVAMIAGDTFLIFEKDGQHRLLQVDGRTPMLKQVEGKWKSFTGRVEYDYDVPVPATPALASNMKPAVAKQN